MSSRARSLPSSRPAFGTSPYTASRTLLTSPRARPRRRPLAWTGEFAGGLIADVKRRAPHYVSDWTDAFLPANRGRCLSSVAFLFFACLAPAIAFGALFAEYTGNELGATEMILSSAISGVAYAFLSGQPLCVLGATGASTRPRFGKTSVRFPFSESPRVFSPTLTKRRARD